jgi:TonB family protein
MYANVHMAATRGRLVKLLLRGGKLEWQEMKLWWTSLAGLLVGAAAPGAEPAVRLPEGAERAQIGSYIRDHLQPLVDCYDQRERASAALKGRLVVRFDIEPNGDVANATAEGMPDKTLTDCVLAEVRLWQFDKPPAGVVLRVAYPILFKPG